LLSSCIDGREEYWLNADGSGAAEAEYELPAAAAALKGGDVALRETIEAWLARQPRVRREACEVATTGDRTRVRVRLAFDSALQLTELSTPEATAALPSSFRHLAGVFDLRVSGRDVELTRTLFPGKVFFGGLFAPKDEFAGRRLVYTLHLPVPALESNATRTTDDGKTLVWDFALADGLKQPLVTRFKARAPLPAWAIPSAVCLGVVLVWTAARSRRLWKRR
jgi:hypothetical protein